MKTVLVTNNYTQEQINIVEKEINGLFNVLFLNDVLANEYLLTKVDYILASGRFSLNKEFLLKLPNLKMIQRTGVGLDTLDLEAINSIGIPLYVNSGVNANSVAEHTIMLMLAALRKLIIINNELKAGNIKRQGIGLKTFELSGKTVGIVGMGNIAKRLAFLLKSFGAIVYYYDINRLDELDEKELNLNYTDLDGLFSNSDIISLHCASNSDTKHIINKNAINKMKDGVIIVNTARGELINTDDLIQAMYQSKVSFACLDVFENESGGIDRRLLKMDNVIITPHIGGVTFDSFVKMIHYGVRNIVCFDKNSLKEIEEFKYRFN